MQKQQSQVSKMRSLAAVYGATTEGGDLSCGFSGCGVIFKVTP